MGNTVGWSMRPGGMAGVMICVSAAQYTCILHIYLASILTFFVFPQNCNMFIDLFLLLLQTLCSSTLAFNILLLLLFGISTSSVLFIKRKVVGKMIQEQQKVLLVFY